MFVLRGLSTSWDGLRIDEKFGEVVVQEGIALQEENRQMRYGEVWAAAQRLAVEVAGHDRVGLAIPLSLEFYCGMLGILAAGATYVPLPLEGSETLVEDAGIHIVVVATEAKVMAVEKVIVLDLLNEEFKDDVVVPARKKNDVATILFTSGSSGRAKGVLLTHRNVRTRIDAYQRIDPQKPGDTMLVHLSTSTLGGMLPPLMALLAGATCFLAPADMVVDPDRLASALDRFAVTVAVSMPSLLIKLADAGEFRMPRVRTLHLTGEAYGSGVLAKVRQLCPNAQLYNMYGMTETCGHTMYHAYHDNVPRLGLPTDNTLAAVVDGELWIAGPGVSPGYLDPKNDSRFVFKDGERWFKTGDMVDRSDDTLRFLGRGDRCVKISGFRVELDAVEAGLLRVSGVAQAAAILSDEKLVAYVVPGTLDGPAVRRASRAVLPAHAVPAEIIVLDALPMTITGKIDRKRLKQPTMEDDDVLRAVRKSIGVCGVDDSIIEAGATSMQLISLVAELRGFNISVADVYRLATPRRIASHCHQTTKTTTNEERAAKTTLRLPLASLAILGHGFRKDLEWIIPGWIINGAVPFIRRRLWYSMFEYEVYFHDAVDVQKFTRTVSNLFKTFPILRATLKSPHDDVLDVPAYDPENIPFRVITDDFDAIRRAIVRRISDFEGSLVEMVLVHNVLYIFIDHAISDVGTLRLLVSALVTSYRTGMPPPPEGKTLGDYADWQATLTPDDDQPLNKNKITRDHGIPCDGTWPWAPFSMMTQETFTFEHELPDRVTFLAAWHRALLNTSDEATSVQVIFSDDCRHATWLPTGYNRTLGFLAAYDEYVSTYLPDLSLRENMRLMQNDLLRRPMPSPSGRRPPVLSGVSSPRDGSSPSSRRTLTSTASPFAK